MPAPRPRAPTPSPRPADRRARRRRPRLHRRASRPRLGARASRPGKVPRPSRPVSRPRLGARASKPGKIPRPHRRASRPRLEARAPATAFSPSRNCQSVPPRSPGFQARKSPATPSARFRIAPGSAGSGYRLFAKSELSERPPTEPGLPSPEKSRDPVGPLQDRAWKRGLRLRPFRQVGTVKACPHGARASRPGKVPRPKRPASRPRLEARAPKTAGIHWPDPCWANRDQGARVSRWGAPTEPR